MRWPYPVPYGPGLAGDVRRRPVPRRGWKCRTSGNDSNPDFHEAAGNQFQRLPWPCPLLTGPAVRVPALATPLPGPAARRVLCWPAFPLVAVLGSTGSAADRSALFVGLHGYYDGVRLLGFVHHRARLLVFPMRTGGVHPPAKPDLPVRVQRASAHARVFTTPGGTALAIAPPLLLSAVVLIGLEGKQYETVTSLLDLPAGTVRSHLYCGRKVLRKLTDGMREESGPARRGGLGRSLDPSQGDGHRARSRYLWE
jgi:hypothetical protein